MKRKIDDKTIEFLYESNLIEGETSQIMLDNAITAWEYLIKQKVLTLGVILKTHKILMKDSGLLPNQKGYLRDVDVWVGGRKGAPVGMIGPRLVMEFIFETMRANPPPDPKALHIKYEQIHPFVDGNGRTGRMFYNWTRIKRCGLPLEVIYNSNKAEYYKWFK